MCNCEICQEARQLGQTEFGTKYVSPTYHHGLAEGFYRSPVHPCGWWTCGGRGCGDCPDCYGEQCECFLYEDPWG